MHAPVMKSITVMTSSEVLFDTFVKTVQSQKFSLDAIDENDRKIQFASGRSAFSWGQTYVGAVTGADGRATLELVCGGTSGTPRALLDGWKNSKSVDKVLAAIQTKFS